MEKINLLYIHGFNSHGNSNTTQQLRKSLSKSSVEVHSPTLDTDPNKTIPFLKNYIADNNIKIIVASSLGGFFALKLKNFGLFTIICNPCVYPSKELYKVGANIFLSDKFEKYEHDILNFDQDTRSSFIGIFGRNDDLFSYKKELEKCGVKSISTNDGHRVSNMTTQNVIVPIVIDYVTKNYNGLKESVVLNERFVNIWDKSEMIQYKDELWRLVQAAYKNVGGGYYGANTADELINDIHFLKLVIRQGAISSLFGYSLKRVGRKGIVCATNGTPQGKADLYKIVDEDTSRKERMTWVEVSDKPEKIYEIRGANPIPAELVRMLLPDKNIIKIHDNGFHYDRMICGRVVTKICYGPIEYLLWFN